MRHPIACALLLALLASPAFAQDPADAPPTAPVETPQAPAEPPAPPAESPQAPAAEVIAPPPATAEAGPIEELRRYVFVFRAIKDAFADPISDQELMRAALRGLLADLDPHSAYLEKERADQLTEMTTGKYVGIGVELEMRANRQLTVVAPVDGGPAARAGIQSGDVIVAVDDKPVGRRDVDSASQGLRGPPGSSVRVRIRRPGETQTREFTLVRAQIDLRAVSGRLLEPGYGYLRIASFQVGTGSDVAAQLKRLEKENGERLRGLVLDLRSNPGGVLSSAVAAADVFLEDGLVVRTRGRLATANTSYRAHRGDLLDGAPVVVLIDSGTASAAEVLAGALQDHRRARLLGSRSFGKGSIQSVVALPNGDAVKLTTGRYYTPNGHSIQARGLTPDKVLAGKSAAGVREQDLPGHLAGTDEAADGYARGEVLDGDAPVAAALVELKAMSVVR
jgi:carboxyl-terminal processing protease